jgi:hypothetical protein
MWSPEVVDAINLLYYDVHNNSSLLVSRKQLRSICRLTCTDLLFPFLEPYAMLDLKALILHPEGRFFI